MTINVKHQRKVGLLASVVLARIFHRFCLPSATGWPALALLITAWLALSFRTEAALFTTTQEAKFMGGAYADHFGSCSKLSADGNTALVATVPASWTGRPGSVSVLVRNGTNWSQQATLTAVNGAAGDVFGCSLSLSTGGNTALVGAYGTDTAGGTDAGSAYVFVRSGTIWTQQAKVTAADGATNDYFGIAVSLSGDGNMMLVGSYGVDTVAGTDAGSAYVFVRSGTNWSQQAKLTSGDGAASDLFGSAVSLNGDGSTALVGARYDDTTAGQNAGSAYVFVRSGTSWSQQAKLTAGGASSNDEFGCAASLSLDGNLALVGALGRITGIAFAFARNGSNWSQQAELTATDRASGDKFGTSVELSGNGNMALIGAPYRNVLGYGLPIGTAYIFMRAGSSWPQQAQLWPATNSAYFGCAASLSSDASTALVGAHDENNNGAAYVFRLSPPAPEIAVRQPGGMELVDGSNTVDFGTAYLLGPASEGTFVITNSGNFDLGGLSITVDGANASEFVVTASPADPVLPGGSTTFTVAFRPTATGTRTAVLHLASNDNDENPFDITFTGFGERHILANLSAPWTGSLYAAPANVTLQADTVLGLGALTRVDFFAGTNYLGRSSSTTNPYAFVWTNAPAGNYALRAVALDSLGLYATSSVVTIDVVQYRPTTSLIPTGSVWKYLDTGTNLGTAWKETNFNDSAWLSGRGQFGYGDGDEATVIRYGSDSTNKYITTYFRRLFNVTNAAGFTNLYARMICDDGAVIYLNGIEVSRYNLPFGRITNLTPAITAIGGTDETTFFWSRRISPLLLKQGTNLLAVEIHQSSGSSSDLSFDLELLGDASGPSRTFPLTASQRGTVTCVDYPNVTYDVYLPPAYTTSGQPLPLIQTFSVGGTGMVGDFLNVAASLNLILIGINETLSVVGVEKAAPDVLHAVMRDLRERVNYDPTAEVTTGMSGGAHGAYAVSKTRRWHVAGVFAMGGNVQGWNHIDRYQTNLFVARSNGDTDSAANTYLPFDSNFLATCSAVIRDWSFPGGHVVSPDSVKTEALTWLLSQRAQPGPNDRTNAMAKAVGWRWAMRLGQNATVLRECLNSILKKPRTWEAHYAEIILDELQSDYASFSQLDVSGLAGIDHAAGDNAVDFFLFRAQGAGIIGDQGIYLSSLKCTPGISNACGDRNAYFTGLLTNYSVPPPCTLRSQPDLATGGVALNFTRQSVGLSYYPEGKNALSAAWQPRTGTLLTNQPGGRATWVLPPEAQPASFYRLRAQPE